MKSAYVSIHGLVVVRADFVGPGGTRSGRLAVDTGAVHTLVRPALLAAIGAHGMGETLPLATVGGPAFAIRMRLDRLRALGIEAKEIAVVARDLPPGFRIDGLLGLDFLRGSRLTIDFRRGEIDLDA